jgi:small conductance mechanosensitive channel
MDFSSLVGTLFDKLNGWLETFVAMLPNLVVAVVVVLVFGLVSKYLSRAVDNGLRRIISSPQLAGLVAQVVRVGVIAGGLFVALSVLQLDKTVTSLLAGIGIAGLALGFAFQDIAANFVSGVLMAVRSPFAVNDLVKVSDFFGRVETIDLRATRLTQLSGETVIIPNKDVFQNAIVNYTETKCRRVEIGVGVSYGDDLRKAKKVALEAVTAIESRDQDREVELFFTGFGGSSVDFELRFWIEQADQGPYLAARSEAIMAIKEAYDANDITIPFPIRTLDFGALGGESLGDHLGEHLKNVKPLRRSS